MTTSFLGLVNKGVGTLDSGIDDDDTSLSVSSDTLADWPASNFVMTLCEKDSDGVDVAFEHVLVASRSGGTCTVSARAQYSSLAQSWAAGTVVEVRVLQAHFAGLQTAINAVETLLSATAGTAAALKALIPDANLDLTGLRNLTLTGLLSSLTLQVGGGYGSSGATIGSDGAISADGAATLAGLVNLLGIHNTGGTGSTGAAASAYAASGTSYNITNASSSTVITFHWKRLGQAVLCGFYMTVTPTAGGTTTYVDLALPVASGLTAEGQCVGGAWILYGTTLINGLILGNATDDRARLRFVSGSTGTHYITGLFLYTVI